MNFGVFSYLVTIIIFAVSAVLIEWILYYKELKKHLKTITISTGLAMVSTWIAESVALSWRIWFYSKDKTFGIYFGAALETYVYAIFVVIAVSSATLIWSDREDDKKVFSKTINLVARTFYKLFKAVK